MTEEGKVIESIKGENAKFSVDKNGIITGFVDQGNTRCMYILTRGIVKILDLNPNYTPAVEGEKKTEETPDYEEKTTEKIQEKLNNV